MRAVRAPDMHPTLSPPDVFAADPIAPRDAALVLDRARALQRAAVTGGLPASLRGRKLGLLCEAGDAGAGAGTGADADVDDAALFRRAAVELGAHVAHIRPSLTELSTLPDVQRTARMLGRLYDAIECQGMATELVHQVGIAAGVPVYDALASAKHPTARLADLLEGEASPPDKRRFVLQAVLLSTIV